MKKIKNFNFKSYDNLEVTMTPIGEFLNEKNIEYIKNEGYHKFKQCQYNALQVSLIKNDINYCEGYADGIIHSWCECNGRYFDPTFELNGMDVSNVKYELVRVFPRMNACWLFVELGETTTTFIKYIKTKKGRFIFDDDGTLYRLGKNDNIGEDLFYWAEQRLLMPPYSKTPTDKLCDDNKKSLLRK